MTNSDFKKLTDAIRNGKIESAFAIAEQLQRDFSFMIDVAVAGGRPMVTRGYFGESTTDLTISMVATPTDE